MTAVVRADQLGKRYGRRRALSECTPDIPAGRVVGPVGPNGAGRTTLLRLVVGQLVDHRLPRGPRRATRGPCGAAEPRRVRRAVRAMAVTLAILVAAQIVVATVVRPHFATPVRLEMAVTARNLSGVDTSGPGGTVRGLQVDNFISGAWILASETADSHRTIVAARRRVADP